ncbi:flagellar hook-length control protein FliK [Acetobacterium tundrae]|uniref:Flagellar hook-length control protein-like C-terminal domain-containing protein n=1 Tax=Acetobacterium tundrae TaxID=132932 RepID=A0ABR6WLG8_9FIRM|nr:flagellar hook-length control protein FliK [Acetobacterium tundrae]MBC3797091.1 hypothetical protein [Acetobacterium tundrae]
MNLEFQSTSSGPTTYGLHSVATSVSNRKCEQKGSYEKSTSFKDQLNQSKSNITQSTIKDRSSQKKESLKESEPTENADPSIEAALAGTENDVKNAPVAENPADDKKQVTSDQSVIGNDLLNLVQSFQNGLATAKINVDSANAGTQSGTPNNTGQVESLSQSATSPATSQLGNILGQGSIQSLEAQGLQGNNGTPLVSLKEAMGQNQEILTAGTAENAQSVQPAGSTVATQGVQQAGLTAQTQGVQQAGLTAQTQGVQQAGLTAKTQGGQEAGLTAQTQNAQQVGLNGQEQKIPTASAETTTSNSSDNAKESPGSPKKATPESGLGTLKELAAQQNVAKDEKDVNSSENNVQVGTLGGITVSKEPQVQPSAHVEVSQQIEQKVLQNYEVNKPVTFTMTLSPKNLGDIDVQMKYDQGKLVINIMAASTETQKLLGKEVNQLVRSLALQNVQVDTVNVVNQTAQSSSQNSASLMNMGTNLSQEQNQAQLKESLIRNNSSSLKNLQPESEEDTVVSINQQFQNYGSNRINYLI